MQGRSSPGSATLCMATPSRPLVVSKLVHLIPFWFEIHTFFLLKELCCPCPFILLLCFFGCRLRWEPSLMFTSKREVMLGVFIWKWQARMWLNASVGLALSLLMIWALATIHIATRDLMPRHPLSLPSSSLNGSGRRESDHPQPTVLVICLHWNSKPLSVYASLLKFYELVLLVYMKISLLGSWSLYVIMECVVSQYNLFSWEEE